MRILCLLTFAAGTVLAGCDNGIGPTPAEPLALDQAPAWSPDGGRIAYHHVERDAGRAGAYPTGLYVLDLATGERVLVVEGDASNPDWHPDGARLAFDAGDVFTVRPDGSDRQRVTTHGSAFFPRWSPDGSVISYSRSGTQEEVGLWIARPEDSTLTRFGFGAGPADWSPNGQRIVFEGPPGEAIGNQIWTADTNGRSRTQLTANGLDINRYAAWSPDGTRIAWMGGSEIRLMRADGSDQHRLSGLPRYSGSPAWSPDSERLAFSGLAPDESRLVLWSARRDGSDLQQITL